MKLTVYKQSAYVVIILHIKNDENNIHYCKWGVLLAVYVFVFLSLIYI